MDTKELFESYLHDNPGTVYADKRYKGFRYVISRSEVCLVAYIFLPSGHPLYGEPVDYLNWYASPHGGFTYAKNRHPFFDSEPSDYWVIGWDYAHLGDATFSSFDNSHLFYETKKVWRIEEIEKDVKKVIDEIEENLEGVKENN